MIVEELIANAAALSSAKPSPTCVSASSGLRPFCFRTAHAARVTRCTRARARTAMCSTKPAACPAAKRRWPPPGQWPRTRCCPASASPCSTPCSPPSLPGSQKENAMDAVDTRPGDTLGMVGKASAPFISRHGHRIDRLFVFDRDAAGRDIYPDWAEDIYLPSATSLS